MIPIGDSPRVRGFPLLMLLLIAANVGVFAYELSLGPQLPRWFQSVGTIPVEILSGRDIPPPAPGPVYVTLFTAMFVHGGFMHLGSNMLYLWVFGDNIEDALGHMAFAVFYLACGVAAGLTHVAVNADSAIPSVGASGAIAGVLGAYVILFPHAEVRVLMFLGPFVTVTRVSALLMIGIWFLTQLLSGVAALEVSAYQTSGVAFWAHIGGFAAGSVLALLLRPALRSSRPLEGG